MMDKETVSRYLNNREDFLNRKSEELKAIIKGEMDLLRSRMDQIPVEMYPQVNRVIGKYNSLIKALNGD